MRLYIDTSATAKLMLREAESVALTELCNEPETHLVAADLIETELRRLALREESPQSEVSDVLAGVDLYPIPRSSFHEAGVLGAPSLRSLDALHLASAIRLNTDAVLTYDPRMSDAATALGLKVVAPGNVGPRVLHGAHQPRRG
ncbi:MAG: type II toxin-antitoxin system VapC family toxin [Actinomycetota bacterium]|nr:type II toxin-antitoxin system VapC family toxin [Actinomycetota bacterium]